MLALTDPNPSSNPSLTPPHSLQHNTTQHMTLHHSTLHHSTAPHITPQHNIYRTLAMLATQHTYLPLLHSSIPRSTVHTCCLDSMHVNSFIIFLTLCTHRTSWLLLTHSLTHISPLYINTTCFLLLYFICHLPSIMTYAVTTVGTTTATTITAMATVAMRTLTCSLRDRTTATTMATPMTATATATVPLPLLVARGMAPLPM